MTIKMLIRGEYTDTHRHFHSIVQADRVGMNKGRAKCESV